ncbi:hypothetical protein BD847_0099 [Flavobacterium cutihirudinis]|uniref:Uncharacterized protein n=1 Tax=Flavobacterium cutihirudinis TaxID=1265740 RepID=A0A3D9FYY1_9FLAO|nr:hypothetical protein [Flavobacterium cutihirudinis]RED26186.1 hypothetical protein BD847_0099 [Flavobacterium cutihirudinis]
MIKEFLVSFKENLETKSSNPFFGTLIIIWFLKNWELFYTLFNFDNKTTLHTKKNFIFDHFKKLPLIENIFICILKAFFVLLISYCLINISRLIINFFEKKVTPLMYKWTDKTSIVLKSIYDISEEERKKLEKRVDEERSSRIKLQDEYDKLEQKLSALLLKQQEQIIQNSKNDFQDSDKSYPSINKEKSKLDLIYEKFKKENTTTDFQTIVDNILNDIVMNDRSSEVKQFISLGLIERDTHDGGNKYYFKLTTNGKDLSERLLIDSLKQN